jgi:hypothetical protein
LKLEISSRVMICLRAWNHCQTPMELSSIIQKNCSVFFFFGLDRLPVHPFNQGVHTVVP